MGGTKATEILLTDDERKAKLERLLGHRFTERGQLQLPSTQTYNSIHTDEGLHSLAIELCRWLGIKPNGLKVAYGARLGQHHYTVSTKDKTIVVKELYRHHPYTAAAYLVFAVIAYTYEHYDHAVPDTAMIEYASIETGLGLWIVNALRPKISHYRRVYHIIDSAWFHAEGLQLTQYQHRQYAELVAVYAHDNRIPVETYIPHILKRCRYLLPAFATRQHTRYLPESNASIMARKSAISMWSKLLFIALIIAAGIGLGAYIAANRSTPSSGDREAAATNLRTLKAAHDTCLAEASAMQSQYDPNDLFLNRQVDAKKADCASLRNEYNYAVDQYIQ